METLTDTLRAVTETLKTARATEMLVCQTTSTMFEPVDGVCNCLYSRHY